MKIISLDPGYDRCGLSILERVNNGKEELIDSTCITTDKQDSFEKRLVGVVDEFHKWIKEYKPDICALENLFFAKNQKTAMRVAEARGALIFTACKLNVQIHEFTPKQVKVAVTGDGGATKQQVMLMVPKLINIEKEIKYDDEYDAIAVGLTASATLSSSIFSHEY